MAVFPGVFLYVLGLILLLCAGLIGYRLYFGYRDVPFFGSTETPRKRVMLKVIEYAFLGLFIALMVLAGNLMHMRK